jgi:hypothetical protein
MSRAAIERGVANAIDSSGCEPRRSLGTRQSRGAMMMRITLMAGCLVLATIAAQAQDVPGIEICTVEKTMERRTSCLQSNVDFLMKTLAKLNGDHQGKIDGALRQIEALRATVIAQQKTIDQMKAAQAEVVPDKDAPAKDAPVKGPPTTDGSSKDLPAAKDAAK